jgi:hypothetical protein
LKSRRRLAAPILASPLLKRPAMKTRRHATATRLPKKIVTTLGELIAAAYGVTAGSGLQRAERAAVLLETSVARRCSRQLRFTR